MTFRPYPLLTIACGAVLAALIWLGIWQLQRADWKRGLIAEFSAQTEAGAADWAEGVCQPLKSQASRVGSATAFRPVDATELERRVFSQQPGSGFSVFGRSMAGVVGWREFRALDVSECGTDSDWILAQTGFVAEEIGDLGLPPVEPVERYVLVRWPDRPPMAGANDAENNEWYWFEGEAMAAAIGPGELNRDFILEPFGGVPSYLTRTPPVRHISYAVTWFGLAICLLIVYVLVHAQTGRLTSRQRDKTDE